MDVGGDDSFGDPADPRLVRGARGHAACSSVLRSAGTRTVRSRPRSRRVAAPAAGCAVAGARTRGRSRRRGRRSAEERDAVAADQRAGQPVVGGKQSLRVVGGDGAEDGQSERTADLLGDVGDPGAESGVGSRNIGHGERQQWHERHADAEADREAGEEDRREEGGVRPDGGEQEKSGGGARHARREHREAARIARRAAP